jgi:hypothetical protein
MACPAEEVGKAPQSDGESESAVVMALDQPYWKTPNTISISG